MKYRVLFLFFGILTLGTSCDKDDDDGCTSETWLGTYSGTLKCPNEPAEPVTFDIELGTLNNAIRFREGGNRTSLPENDFEVNGCTVVNKRYDINWLGGPIQTIWSGSLTDNSLSIDIEVNLLGLCEIRATR